MPLFTLQEDSYKRLWQRTLCLQNMNFFLHFHICHSIYLPIICFLHVLVLPVLPGYPLHLPSAAGQDHSKQLNQLLQQFYHTLPLVFTLTLRKWPAILIHNTFRNKTPITAQLSHNTTALDLSTQQPSIAGHCSNVPGWQTNSCSSGNPRSHLSSPLTSRPASCSLEAFPNVRVGKKIFCLF